MSKRVVTRQEAIEFLKGLGKAYKEHYKLLDEYGYSDFPKNETHPCAYGFFYKGVFWDAWDEASDPDGARKAILYLFNGAPKGKNEAGTIPPPPDDDAILKMGL